MKSPHFILLGACVVLAFAPVWAADDAPPEELFSPDKNFNVKMLPQPMPGADPDDYTLVVRAKDKVLSRQTTEGYLINAFWTADGKYVAVNNRRANSGDYLWVFSLKDGRPMRIPDDSDEANRKVAKRIEAKFPEEHGSEIARSWTVALGWESSTELTIRIRMSFTRYEDTYFQIIDTYKMVDGKLVLEDEKIERRSTLQAPTDK